MAAVGGCPGRRCPAVCVGAVSSLVEHRLVGVRPRFPRGLVLLLCLLAAFGGGLGGVERGVGCGWR